MTPQERELVADLFRRLAALERNPRDPDAERLIRDGLAQAPNAVYSLVQTVLVQDEALKMADERIRALEDTLNRAQPEEHPRGFLDNLRDSVFGGGPGGERRGSVPSAGRRMDEPMGAPGGGGGGGASPWGSGAGGYGNPGAGYGAPTSGYGRGPTGGGMGAPMGGGMGAPMGGGMGGGGSFLGTAAAVAAGAVGGGLLMNGIRGMMGGGGHGGPFQGAFDHLSGGGESGGGFGGGAGSSDLAREAGLGDIGGGGGRSGLMGDDRFGSGADYAQGYGPEDDAGPADFDDGVDVGGSEDV